MAKERATIKKYLKYCLLSLKLVGIWSENESVFKTKFYWIYTVVVNFFILGTFNLCQIVYFVIHGNDLELLASSGYMIFIFWMPNLKSLFFFNNTPIVKSLVSRLDSETFQPKTRAQRKHVNSLLRFVPTIHIVYLVNLTLLLPLWMLPPLFKKSAQKELVFMAWYLYDWRKPVFYELSYFHQCLGVFFTTVTNLNLDVLVFALTVYIGVECDILADTIDHIEEFALRRSLKSGNCLNDDGRVENKRGMNEVLLACIAHHNEIFKFAADVNVFLSNIVFVQFASSLIDICLTMFQLTVVTPFSPEFIAVCVWQFGIFVEIFMYCFFGHIAITKSNNVANALYSCPWVNSSKEFRRNILFCMHRSQRPIQLFALNFFVLSLPTCTSILRASWSFFAMLRQTHDK